LNIRVYPIFARRINCFSNTQTENLNTSYSKGKNARPERWGETNHATAAAG
jgi:hypothetical protein